MKFTVLKPFTWAGADLGPSDHVEIPDESPKIGPLTRAKFIRYDDGTRPPKELPKVEEVAQEMANEEPPEEAAPVRSPREIVRQAKAKATAKA